MAPSKMAKGSSKRCNSFQEDESLEARYKKQKIDDTTTTTSQACFLGLPAELRNAIYSALFTRDSLYVQRHCPGCLFKDKYRLKEIPLFRTRKCVISEHLDSYGRILLELFKRETEITSPTNTRSCRRICHGFTGLNILLASRQIYTEAQPLLWHHRTLIIDSWVREGNDLVSGPTDASNRRSSLQNQRRIAHRVKQLHYPTIPFPERDFFVQGLSCFKNLCVLEIPADFASQGGILKLRGAYTLRNLRKVYVTAITEIGVRVPVINSPYNKNDRSDNDNDNDSGRDEASSLLNLIFSVTLYVHTQQTIVMSRCWLTGHKQWLQRRDTLNITFPRDRYTCPDCYAMLIVRQEEIRQWYDWEAHTTAHNGGPVDVVGRVAKAVELRLRGRVPFVEDWQNGSEDRWMEGNWCMMRVKGKEFEGKGAECRILGLRERPIALKP